MGVSGQAEEEERLLKRQLKAVHDDYRRAKRGADGLAEERAGLEDRIQELHLSNEARPGPPARRYFLK